MFDIKVCGKTGLSFNQSWVLTSIFAVFLNLEYQKDQDCSVWDPAKTETVVWPSFSPVQSGLRFFYHSLRLDLETLIVGTKHIEWVRKSIHFSDYTGTTYLLPTESHSWLVCIWGHPLKTASLSNSEASGMLSGKSETKLCKFLMELLRTGPEQASELICLQVVEVQAYQWWNWCLCLTVAQFCSSE